MANPIFQMLFNNKLSQVIGPVRQMMQTVKMAQNPTLALQQMASQNPQIQQAMQMIQQSGGDPKTAFENLCKEQGLDPQQILSMLGWN